MSNIKHENFDFITIAFHGKTTSENKLAKVQFYGFITELEFAISMAPTLRYQRTFLWYNKAPQHFKSFPEAHKNKFPNRCEVRAQNGSVFRKKAKNFYGAPCIYLYNQSYQPFFKLYLELLLEMVSPDFLYLSRMDVKFKNIQIKLPNQSLNTSLEKKTKKVNSVLDRAQLFQSDGESQINKTISSDTGNTYYFGNREEDVFMGRLVSKKANETEGCYFELEIKDSKIKLCQDGILEDFREQNEPRIIAKALKNVLPFFDTKSTLLKPQTNLSSKIFQAFEEHPDLKPEIFFDSKKKYSERGLDPAFEPLVVCFSSKEGFIVPKTINLEFKQPDIEHLIFELKVYRVITKLVKNYYFARLQQASKNSSDELTKNNNFLINEFRQSFCKGPFVFETPISVFENDLVYKKSRVNRIHLKNVFEKIKKRENFILNINLIRSNAKKEMTEQSNKTNTVFFDSKPHKETN